MYRVTYSTVLSYIIRLTHHRYYQLLMEVIIKLISSEIETCIIDISSVCLNIKEKKEFSLGHWWYGSTIPWLDSLYLKRFKVATSSLYTNCKITNNQIM